MRVGWLSAVVVLVGCGSTPGSESHGSSLLPDAGLDASGLQRAAEVPASTDAGPFGFRRDVYPIFVTHCGECHSVNGPYHDIASEALDEAYADAVEFADRVVARIRQGNMPPGCVFDDTACVPAAELETVELWIAEGLPE